MTLARILSNIPPSRGGPCSTLIFDIHALQERFYFGDQILPCFESGIPLLLNRLAAGAAPPHVTPRHLALPHCPPRLVSRPKRPPRHL